MPNPPPTVLENDLRLLPLGLYRMAKALLRSVDKRFPVYADSWRIAGLRAEVEKADLALAKPQPAFNAGVINGFFGILPPHKITQKPNPPRGAEQRDAHGYLINEVTAKARDIGREDFINLANYLAGEASNPHRALGQLYDQLKAQFTPQAGDEAVGQMRPTYDVVVTTDITASFYTEQEAKDFMAFIRKMDNKKVKHGLRQNLR